MRRRAPEFEPLCDWPIFVPVLPSLLAQRVIAIMAGDPSAMSEYAQERLMSPALVKMETLGERRRRVMQRQINQENQVGRTNTAPLVLY